MKILRTLLNVGFVMNDDYIDNDVKVRDNCLITGQYRGSLHRDCNFNLKLNHKIAVGFHNLKKWGSHFVMQELSKFNLKRNVISNGLKIYMSFTISNKLSFY